MDQYLLQAMIAEWKILVRFPGFIRGDTIIQHAKIENATCAMETSNGVRKDRPNVSSYRLHLGCGLSDFT